MRHFLLITLWITSLPLDAQSPLVACKPEFGMGFQLLNAGQYAAAAETYSAAVDDAKQQLGPEHMDLVPILTCLGGVRVLQGDYPRAKAAFEKSLTILEKGVGPDHIRVGFTLGTIALLTHKEGYYAAAEPQYRRALTILEGKPGPAEAFAGLLQASMAKLYLVQERNTEAEALLEKAIPVLAKDDTNSAQLATALDDLAECYQRDGRYAKAEPLYARLLSLVEGKPEIINDDIRAGLRAYIRMFREPKRKPEARQLEQLKSILPK